jgi:hypothetical protein
MPTGARIVQVYEELANWEEQRDSAQTRDRFLILAADAALSQGLNDEAERLRARLLQHNPHHLLKPYPSLAEAMKSPDVYSYVADLRNSYAPEEAESLLESLRSGGPPLEERETAGPAVLRGTFGEAADPPAPDDADLSPPIYPLTAEHESATEVDAGHAEPIPEAPAPLPAAPRRRPKAAEPKAPGERLARLSPAPEVYPYPVESQLRELAEPEGTAAESGERSYPFSRWVGDTLFAVVFVAALALLVYTLARPFFPL